MTTHTYRKDEVGRQYYKASIRRYRRRCERTGTQALPLSKESPAEEEDDRRFITHIATIATVDVTILVVPVAVAVASRLAPVAVASVTPGAVAVAPAPPVAVVDAPVPVVVVVAPEPQAVAVALRGYRRQQSPSDSHCPKKTVREPVCLPIVGGSKRRLEGQPGTRHFGKESLYSCKTASSTRESSRPHATGVVSSARSCTRNSGRRPAVHSRKTWAGCSCPLWQSRQCRKAARGNLKSCWGEKCGSDSEALARTQRRASVVLAAAPSCASAALQVSSCSCDSGGAGLTLRLWYLRTVTLPLSDSGSAVGVGAGADAQAASVSVGLGAGVIFIIAGSS